MAMLGLNRNVVWGYLGQFLQYGAALLILPVLLKKLTSAELGVWYVFLTISALVTMLDLGFTPTLARNVSYVLGGATKLFRNGFEVVEEGNGIDYGLLRTVIEASREIFLWLSVIAFVVLSTLGTWYIVAVAKGLVSLREIAISWVIFVFATLINLYFKYFTPLLQGRGLFAKYYKASAISNLSFVAATTLMLYLGYALIAVSGGFLVSALVGRWLSGMYFYDKEFSAQIASAPKSSISTRELIRVLWSNAWRLGLVVVGSFFTLRANTLLASAYLGLTMTATYGLTLQVFSTIQSIAMVAFIIEQPRMARYRVAANSEALLRLIKLGLAISILLYIAGALLIVIFGNELIAVVGGHTQMLNRYLLALVAIMILLELNHTLAASVIVTRNIVPFVKPALLSGFAITACSGLGLHFFGFHVAWLVVTQFIVQAMYNNWKWPTVLAKEFKTTYLEMIVGGIRIASDLLFGKKTLRAAPSNDLV